MKIVSDVGPWSVVPEWVLDAEVSDRAIRLYALLGRYADGNGESYAKRRTLSERMRCSVASVDRAVLELNEIGALEVDERHRDDGSQSSNLYTLRMSSPVSRGVITREEGGVITREDPKNESQKERETSLAAPKNGRPRNEIWDALAHIFGEPTTPSATKVRGKACNELKTAGASGEEIVARAKRWPHHYDGAILTELALIKHWDALGRQPLRSKR